MRYPQLLSPPEPLKTACHQPNVSSNPALTVVKWAGRLLLGLVLLPFAALNAYGQGGTDDPGPAAGREAGSLAGNMEEATDVFSTSSLNGKVAMEMETFTKASYRPLWTNPETEQAADADQIAAQAAKLANVGK